VNMPVVFRPGPYICAEWTGGGLPGWLWSKKGMQVRTFEAQYIAGVNKFWGKLLPLIKPELAENGGAVIMVQLENEYGVFGDTIGNPKDKMYIEHLKTLAETHLGKNVQLFTDDCAFGGYPLNDAMFKRGGIPGVFRAINLGPESIIDDKPLEAAKRLVKQMNPNGKAPFYIAETYSGWFTKWEEQRVTRKKTKDVVKAMQKAKDIGASFGLYMVHGGTNFGFWAGYNDGSFLTSYDYNAPIRGGGDHGFGLENTDKYAALQKVFGGGRELVEEPPLPVFQTLESVDVEFAAPLRQEMDSLCHNGWQKSPGGPKPAEMYGHHIGMEAYRYKSFKKIATSEMKITGKSSDSSYMWVDSEFHSHAKGPKKNVVFAKTTGAHTKGQQNFVVDIVVDTHGRTNFAQDRGALSDTRGLWAAAVNGKPLNSGEDGQWSICNLRFDDVSALHNVTKSRSLKVANPGPSFFAANVHVTDATKDTFLHPGEGWEQGVAFFNGFNLGRYDMSSPQKELYVPASLIQEGSNDLLMLETGEKALKREKMGPIDFITKRLTHT